MRITPMARRFPAHAHPYGESRDEASRWDARQLDAASSGGGSLTEFLESAAQPVLPVTFWFEPVPHAAPYPATVRFSGHRVGVEGRLQPGDRFVHDEHVAEVVPGSGPVSVTARIRGVNSGEWSVSAHLLGAAHPAHGHRKQENIPSLPIRSGTLPRLWRSWAPPPDIAKPVSTCLLPFARVPGTLPGIWAAMVGFGMIAALALQAIVLSADHLAIAPAWALTVGAIVIGIVGAKLWYIVLRRREHRFGGWCIQGFIVGATVAAAILVVLLDVPVGTFLDATAPGLMFGLAIGRVGCFFAGCCGGPPTASRWGVWSSDQRVGARRIPTQLMESALALSIGVGILAAVLSHGPAGGGLFAAALAAYTLVRQWLLHLRAEPRETKLGGRLTAALSALVLIAAIVVVVL